MCLSDVSVIHYYSRQTRNIMKDEKLNTKSRRFEIIAFEESMPDGWEDILSNSGYHIAYILHDKDVDNKTGEIKKSHYHILLDAGTAVRMNTIYRAISKPLCQSMLPIVIKASNKRFDYLTHKNNPEKAQYNEEDIVLLNDFDRIEFERKGKTDTDQVDTFNHIADIIEDHDIKSVNALYKYLRMNNEYECMKFILQKHSFVKSYIDTENSEKWNTEWKKRISVEKQQQYEYEEMEESTLQFLDDKWLQDHNELTQYKSDSMESITSVDDLLC